MTVLELPEQPGWAYLFMDGKMAGSVLIDGNCTVDALGEVLMVTVKYSNSTDVFLHPDAIRRG